MDRKKEKEKKEKRPNSQPVLGWEAEAGKIVVSLRAAWATE